MFGMTSTEQNTSTCQIDLDKCLVRIAAGERDALAELYSATKTAVYGFILSIVKNATDAEDALQDTYVKIWSAAESYRSQGKPMAWVFTIARNNATSILRDKSKTVDIPEEEWQTCYADNPAVSSDDKIVLKAAMETLADDERQIIMLHAVGGMKHIEIAKIMGLPISTVLSKYSRAKKKLQKTLEEGEKA